MRLLTRLQVNLYHGHMNTKSALKKAVEVCGSQSELARRLGLRQGHVWHWLKVGRVPPERCKPIESATGGLVSRRDLRPDVFDD